MRRMIKIYKPLAFLLILPKLLFGAELDDWDRHPERHPAAVSGPYVDVRDHQVFYEKGFVRNYPKQTRYEAAALKHDIRRWPVVSKEMFYVLCGLKPSEFGLVQRIRVTSSELFRKEVRGFVQELQTSEHNLLSFLTDKESSGLLRYLAFQCVMPTGTVVLEKDPTYVAPPPAVGREEMTIDAVAKDYAGTSLVERRLFEGRRRRLDFRRLTFEGESLSLYFRLLMRAEYDRIRAAKQGYQDLSARLREEKECKIAKIIRRDRNVGSSVAVLIGSQIDEGGEERMKILAIPSTPVFASGAVFVDVPGTEVKTSSDRLAYLTAPELPYPVCSLGSFVPEQAVAATGEARREMTGRRGASGAEKKAGKAAGKSATAERARPRSGGAAGAAAAESEDWSFSSPRVDTVMAEGDVAAASSGGDRPKGSGAAGSGAWSPSTVAEAVAEETPHAMGGAGRRTRVLSPTVSVASLPVEEGEEPETSAKDQFRLAEARLYAEAGEVSHGHSPGAADSYYAGVGNTRSFTELPGRGHVRFHSHSEQAAARYYRKVMIPQIQEMLVNNPSFRLRKILLGVFTDRDPCPICACRIQHECAAFKIRHLSGGGVVEEHRLAGLITGYRDFGAQVLTGDEGEPEFAYRSSRDPETEAEPHMLDLSAPDAFALVTGTETGDPV